MTNIATVNELRNLEVSVRMPFAIKLDGKQQVAEIQKVYRHLPGKRLATQGLLEGRKVFFKFFYDSRKAKRDYLHEQNIAHLLLDKNIPAARLLASGSLGDGGYWLAQEFLENAINIKQLINSPKFIPDSLQPLYDLIDSLYKSGGIQEDIHLENVCISQGRLYLMDAGGVKFSKRLNNQCFVNNLALFAAQFPVQIQDVVMTAIFKRFSGHRQVLQQLELNDWRNLVLAQWRKRLEKVAKKVLRSSSLAHLQKIPNGLLRLNMIKSNPIAQWVEPALQIPQAFAKGKQYELSHQTISLTTFNGEDFFITRFTGKKTSLAQQAWQVGFVIEHMGLTTLRPLAMLEKKRFGVVFESYLVTESLPGLEFALIAEVINRELDEEQQQWQDWLSTSGLSLAEPNSQHFFRGEKLYLVRLENCRQLV